MAKETKNIAEIKGSKFETKDEDGIVVGVKYVVKIVVGDKEVKIQIGEKNYEEIKKLFL